MEKKLLPLVHKHLHGERVWARPWRWAKTAFFLAAMLASLLLVCAPPLLVVLLDVALPPALFSATLRAAGTGTTDSTFASAAMAQARAFDFRFSLVDLPAVSAARAALILCAYALCGGGAAYFWVVVACSASSMSYVLAKAAAMLPHRAATQAASTRATTVAGPDTLILLSLTLAVAHLAVAYRTSCRERRRLLVYRIDVEAVRLKGGHQTPKGLKQCSV